MKNAIICTVLLSTACFAFGQENVSMKDAVFELAGKKKAAQLLTAEDDFVKNLSPFDLSARLKTAKAVSKKEYLDFVGKQTMDWTADEKSKMQGLLKTVKDEYTGYTLTFPKTIYIIKTSGAEEGDAAYCRGLNIIVFPKRMIDDIDKTQFQTIIIHELFHIYSRNHLAKREKLYNLIGYYKSADLVLPDDLRQMKITNPDSVVNNYYFLAKINGQDVPVMPLLIAKEKYDQSKGGEFFNYMQLIFFAVDTDNGRCVLKVKDGQYQTYTWKEIPNYLDMVGKNTEYIIHAEEILADTVSFIIDKKTDRIQSPEIAQKIEAELKD